MKKILIILGSGLALVGIGYWFGYYKSPTKVVTKTKIQVIEKKVEVKNVNRDITTTTTKKADGSVVTIVEDKSVEKTDSTTDTKSKEYTTVVETRDVPKWHLSAIATLPVNDPSQGFNYGVSLDRRLIGPVWLGGIYVHQPKLVGFRLSVSF